MEDGEKMVWRGKAPMEEGRSVGERTSKWWDKGGRVKGSASWRGLCLMGKGEADGQTRRVCFRVTYKTVGES